MKRYLLRTPQDALLVWVALTIGIIITAILYATLNAVQVPRNISLLIAFLTLVSLIILTLLPVNKSILLRLKERVHRPEKRVSTQEHEHVDTLPHLAEQASLQRSPRLPRAFWIAIMVTGILTVLGSVMGNIGATALTWLSPWVALVLFVLISLSLIGVSLWQERQKATSEPSAADASKYRQSMLGRVQNRLSRKSALPWLSSGLKEHLLPSRLRMRVGSRFDLVLSNPLEPTQTIPSGATLTQVFDQAGGELLILGEPGAGKTTLLLELARDLLKRAKDNPAAPIPVMLTLSSWATRKLPLEQWIAEELQAEYQVPSRIGKAEVKANQLLLLLDGLDEVTPDALQACIEAINAYSHQAHRSLVVSSRTKEFQGQPGRLALHTAVIVQPLSSEHVDNYLDDLATKEEDVEGLK